MKRPFKVGDITRSIKSRWPLMNHRLVEIVAIADVPRTPGKPYCIKRVDGEPWCFPARCPNGKLRFYTGVHVWASEADLLPIDDADPPAAERTATQPVVAVQ